jgi:hypothetical protein
MYINVVLYCRKYLGIDFVKPAKLQYIVKFVIKFQRILQDEFSSKTWSKLTKSNTRFYGLLKSFKLYADLNENHGPKDTYVPINKKIPPLSNRVVKFGAKFFSDFHQFSEKWRFSFLAIF